MVELFSGNYDANYVNNRLRIGLVHKRIGVELQIIFIRRLSSQNHADINDSTTIRR
ncbi:MAG: protoglobin domain-containing protein [Acinetobacter sp.]